MFSQLITKRAALAACLALVVGTASAELPSTLRSLSDSYRALRTGMGIETAVELMGNPKSRSDHAVLGVGYANLVWLDIEQVQYEAQFVGNYLMHKSAKTNPK